MMKNLERKLLVLAALCLLLAMPSRAQEFGRDETMTAQGTSYYSFHQEGEATVQVTVLGAVGKPGIYEVGIGVDLGELLALTGGPPLTESEGVTSTRTDTTIRLLREATGRRDVIFDAPLDLVLSEPGLYPPLQDGDVLTINAVNVTSQRFQWRDALSIFSTLLSAAVLIDRLSYR